MAADHVAPPSRRRTQCAPARKERPLRLRRRLALTAALLAGATAATVAAAVPPVAAGQPAGAPCDETTAVGVPGAEKLLAALPDLTTAHLTTLAPGRYTDAADWPACTHPGRRVRPAWLGCSSTATSGHVEAQRQPRLGARRAVRHPAARRLRSRRHRRVRSAQAVRERPAHLRLSARAGVVRLDGQGQQRRQLLHRRTGAGRRRRRVARARHRARPGGEGSGEEPVRALPPPDVNDRHQQRRLPDALAAREPSRAL